MYNTIEGMKHLLKQESQLEIEKDGKEKFNDAIWMRQPAFLIRMAREKYYMIP